MPLGFRDGYSTVITSYTFETISGQFGTDQDRLEYEKFFGLGGGEDDPFRVPFNLPLSLSIDLPFVGTVELFSARLFGELAATFGLQITAAANNGAPDPSDPNATPTGTITSVLPYALSYAYPLLDPVEDAGELITLNFAHAFFNGEGAGFTTLFPRLEFSLDLVAGLSAKIGAEVGAMGSSTDFTVLDFAAGTTYELFSIDTGRRDAEGEKDPVNIMGGTTTQEIIEDIEWLDPFYDREGEFAGVEIPFNQFFSKPETKDKPKADAEVEGQTAPDGEKEEEQRDPPDPAGLDLGSLRVLVPNINAASKYVDGVFVTDPSKRVLDGEVIDDLDADGFPQERGNKGDIAVLTIDVDGLVTYATGGAFPPLEFQFEQVQASIADVLTLTADFYYNLFDVELVASLPLVQEFTMTPEIATRLNFFEVNPDGSKGAAKPMEIVQLERVLLFDENGSFQSEAVAKRLAELAETSTLRVAQDVAQFVDPAAGVPGAFTGQTASIGGRVVVREGDGPWRELFTNAADPIARSAPALGQDQLQPLDLSNLSFGYKIFRDDDPNIDFEIEEFDFDEAASIFRFETRETVAPLVVTPYLTDLDALNLRYDGEDTWVEAEYRAQPVITNRTGLDFDLELVLSALQMSAEFGAYVDLGFTEIGGSIEFDFGPLWRERFPLFSASLVDFYNEEFQVFDDANSHVESFVLGAAPPAADYGDAIVGTENGEVLTALPAGSAIVMLGGDDTVFGGAGDDTIYFGAGRNRIDGGGGYDRLEFGLIETPLVTNELRDDFGQRIGVSYSLFTLSGLPAWGAHRTARRDGNGDLVDRAADDIHIDGIEEVLFTEAIDDLILMIHETPPTFQVPERFDLRGGNDRASIEIGYAPLEARGLTVLGGEGDDTIGIFVNIARTTDWSAIVIDGGTGRNTLEVDADFDLSRPVGEQGALGARITGFVDLTAWANYDSETIPEAEGGGTRNIPLTYHLTGDDRANRIEGAIFDDTLIGNGGNDTLIGNDGNDLLIGGAGADEMIGGTGIDTVSYAIAATSVFIDLDFHGDGIGRGFRGEAQGDVLREVENVIGSDFDDILIGRASAAHVLTGGMGNDRLMAKGYNDTLIGGEGDDLLAAGGQIFRSTATNNVYEGGEGFDILALQTFDPVTITGNLNGFARYTYLTGNNVSSSNTTTGDRNITVKYRYEQTGHVKATLDEDGNGTVEYWQDDASGRIQATGFSGTATYSDRADASVINWFPGYFTKTSTFNYNFTAKTLDKIAGQSISFTKTGDNPNGTGRITTVPNAPNASKGGLLDTETFTGIEGLIGTAGDDRLVGNSKANALYGNGGWDLIAGGGDGNLLGFGEGQKIADIFSFPGRPSGGGSAAPIFSYPTLEQLLTNYDPYGTMDGLLSIPVGRIRIGDSTQTDRSQVVGSMLWGQGQDNTLDMRFDRGISFFPDRSTSYAVVDLNVASAGAGINAFTGEQVMYGRAEWRAANGTLLTQATTFGVHNVIGSQNGDTIRGDRADNVIEGMAGADFMDGEGGIDTLSYARAPDGVTLNMGGNGGDGLIVFNQGAGREGRGHATGDRAYNFERFVLSEHDDIVLIDIPLARDVQFETFGNEERGLSLPTATPYQNAPHVIELGAGEDHLRLVGGPRVLADLGEGDDSAEIAGPGQELRGGAGDDRISIVDPGQVLLQEFSTAQRTTIIEGGAGRDTVILDGGTFLGLTLTATGVIVEQAALTMLDGDATAAEKAVYLNGAPTLFYDLRDIEFLEIDGARFRLDPLDATVQPNRTLTITEDARAPFALELSATAADIAAGVTFEVAGLPQGAAILGPNGSPLALGAVVAADDIASLRARPGQEYGQADEYFRFIRSDAPGVVEAIGLPSSPPIPGISLGLTAPVDPLGEALSIRVTGLPDHGTVFYRAAVPELAALGLLVPVEVPVNPGDMLTPDQLENLYFSPGLDATGPAGTFSYTVDHGQGLGGIEGIPVRFAAGLSASDYDGLAAHRTTITITAVDDAPRVSRLLFPMSPGGTLEGTVEATDPEGQDFTLALISGPGRGSIDLDADGSFTYRQTAAIDFAGEAFVEEVFTVRATQTGNGLASADRPQTIRIVNPEFLQPIVFDVAKPDVFFEEDGTPVKLGGLGTDDRIIGANGIDNELHGFGGNDLLQGLGGRNRLFGGDGNDTVEGGSGTDTLNGDDGDDFLFGGSERSDLRDVIFGGAGRDYIDGGWGNDELHGGIGHDTMLGDFGADTLIGNSGDDLLGGGAGSDLMFGGPGNDTLNGGWGFDRMNGGTGADGFYHAGVRDHASDWIQDYNAADGDVLIFGLAGATRAQFQVNTNFTPGAGSADTAEAFVIYRPTGQIMWALVDGDAQSQINLQLGGTVFDLLA